MTFEEQFPNLRGFVDEEYELGLPGGPKSTGKLSVDIEHIQKHCLDKQRVREAIANVCVWPNITNADEVEEDLFKELGLED